ncbi:ATP-binding protein [Pseudonocardia sp. CA-142604]|uniref:ATP-binding protein n=1 Tax=Pseudonocardia sp. CA-142604 TaxID=3240024 RepID=UPI003D8A2DD1
MPEIHPVPDTAADPPQPVGRSVHRGQFRITRLQIINWGTFTGYRDLKLDERGVLFTGPSGSGKSSLLDAHSIVLLSAYDQRFNASADLTARGSKQASRTVADYVRGAWSETNDEREQSRVRHLRAGKPTWSAVAATYSDGLGSTTTAVVVKWFPGTETDSASLKTMHQLHRGEFDLSVMEEWAARGFDLSWFKKTYPNTHYDGQGAYLRELSKRVGIGTAKSALPLLGKAKAMKNVGDLNLFIRDNMLDRPATFEDAQKMLDAFTPLNDAYKAAQRAHTQAKALREVPGNWHTFCSSTEAHSRAQDMLGASMERYLRGVELRAIETELDDIDREIARLDAESGRLDEECSDARATFLSLRDQFNREGAALSALEGDLGVQQAEARARLQAHGMYGELVRAIGQPVPQNKESFTGLAEQAADIAGQAQAVLDKAMPRRHDVFSASSAAHRVFREKSHELEALRTARNLIPQHRVERRDLIAAGANVPAEDIVYAAELIDVAKNEQRWRPAAEKVLRNFGLRLLVPEHHQDAVKRFIDENDMKSVVEYSVVPAAAAVPAPPAPGTLAAKLIVNTDHPAGPWLATQLAARFNHHCVESAADLADHPLAVTVRGTVKMPGRHYRKDDRPEVSLPSAYILGGNIAVKCDALTVEVAELERAAHEADAAAKRLESAITDATGRRDAAQKLAGYTRWRDLDHWSTASAAEDIIRRIADLKANDVNLADLETRRDAAEAYWTELVGKKADLDRDLTRRNNRQTKLIEDFDQEEPKPHTIDDADDRAYLDEVLAAVTGPDTAPVTVDTMLHLRHNFRKELQHCRDSAEGTRHHARSNLQTAIAGFIEQWPDAAPDTSGDVERSGGDFARLYAEIVERNLPAAMDKLERMISGDMVPSISFLHRSIVNAAEEIRARIKMVNAGLRRVEFDEGAHLQIVITAHESVEVKEFRAAVDAVLRHAPGTGTKESRDPAVLLAQFRRVQELMRRFTDTAADAVRWRTQVLDVRNTYTFYGREENTDGETTKTYRNTAVNSGGEQEKLVAFCLAAALSYNLAAPDSDGRPTFAPLMLDEAFSKSDEKYAQQALAAFEEFGFQLIMAAPIRMSGIVEPYIGQAVLVDKHVNATEARSTVHTATFGELTARRRGDYDTENTPASA